MFSSNRTFMELKYGELQLWNDGDFVLIVPLWNWNKAQYGEESAASVF